MYNILKMFKLVYQEAGLSPRANHMLAELRPCMVQYRYIWKILAGNPWHLSRCPWFPPRLYVDYALTLVNYRISTPFFRDKSGTYKNLQLQRKFSRIGANPVSFLGAENMLVLLWSWPIPLAELCSQKFTYLEVKKQSGGRKARR